MPLMPSSPARELRALFALSAFAVVSVHAASYPAWQPDTFYAAGSLVSYDGGHYRALVDQTDYSGAGWNPRNPSLWSYLGNATPAPAPAPAPAPSPAPSPAPAPAPTPAPAPAPSSCAAPWSSGAVYTAGQTASVNGVNYRANYWTQGQNPAQHNGGAGSGQPWTQVAACSPAPAPAPAPAPNPGGRMYIGYAGTWNTSLYDLTPANIPNYITHVNLAFAKPNTGYVKGSFAFDQQVAGFEFAEGASTPNGQRTFTPQQAQDLRSNIAALRARGTQVWVSIGGWAYSQGAEWAGFNAKNVVDLALDLGASGIDVDWESSGASCNKLDAANFSCTTDSQIVGIIDSLHAEIQSRGAALGISVAGWSTGAYYVKGTPFEEGKVQWGSPFGGVMYTVVKTRGHKLSHVNLMSYDGGDYYDPREGYESYRAIYGGPINMGMEIAPEGAGGAVLTIPANGVACDADMLTGQNNVAKPYYNVETLVHYVKHKGRSYDGFMLWQIWKQRVHQPAPAGAATENTAGQYVCRNLPLAGDCNQSIPSLPKISP